MSLGHRSQSTSHHKDIVRCDGGVIKTRLCDVFQRPTAAVAPRAETWTPGAAGLQSVRQQARYDQSRTEEHPGAAESDEDDDEDADADADDERRYEL